MEQAHSHGKTRSNGGWTTLHLASYFGQKDIVEELLKNGVEVNTQNDVGDTALHIAALCGRKEVVLLLLRYGACATLLNGCAQTPRDITDDDEVITMLEAAERREGRKLEERLLDAARDGDCGAVAQLLSKNRPPDINCKDSHGDTALHIAACRGHKECVDVLVKSGASFSAVNKNGQSVLDVAKDDQTRFFLEKCQENTTCITARKFEGLLWKKSDFLSWNSLWVVLEKGTVSWYCNQSDAACGDRRQGCKPLMKAQCVVKAWDKYFFTLKCCDGSVHHFKVSSRCSEPEITRKKWVDAMEEHAVYSALCGSPDKTPVQEGEQEVAKEAMDLGDFLSHSLQAAESYQRMLESQVAMFVSMVKNEDNNDITVPELLKAKEICELCSETSSVLRHCVDLLSQREEVWSVKLEQEVEKNKLLSEALQKLATEHHQLKLNLSTGRKSPTLSAFTEDEFYDAVSESEWDSSVRGRSVSVLRFS
ncbi:hypothetical protein PHYPO_G00190340 [Pangasianodon hypophthalmus]|uniref:PH domain-containing protein n=1 Tax=Pangasianodon hypophthalmus TaxID=310915 RepID=A0A5N5PK16_PANHP|nr:hypothetical protein PHYPO_G00190340 [Pangasianodon hypophthalmus]